MGILFGTALGKVNNSYWGQIGTSKTNSYGEERTISALSYGTGYNTWDFESVWNIDEGETLAYLKCFNDKFRR